MKHGGLLVQRSQVGGAGDVAADRAGEVVDVQRHAVFGDGGAQDGNIGGRRQTPPAARAWRWP